MPVGRLDEHLDHLGPHLIVTAPLSALYALGWEAYLATYKLGLKKPARPHRPVICVGNLRVGGSGKTPTVRFLAETLQDMGYGVTLGASGYGSPSAQAAQMAPAGPLDPATWGDEPALLREYLPEVPLIVGRRRVLAAEICARETPDHVLLMDDGFQHLPLHKDIAIVLDAPGPNRFPLPAGPYREPRWNLGRADLVLPSAQFGLYSRGTRLATPEGEPLTPEPGTEVDLVSALAQPFGLSDGLHRLGLRLREVVIRPDHDPLTDGNLLVRLDPERPLVASAKDWVKLRRRPDIAGRIVWVADYSVWVEPQDAFRAWLKERLDGLDS